MTGKAILEALSFVDDEYIEEAENRTIRPAFAIKKLLPLAACLCAALLGLFSLDDLLPRQETTAPDTEMQAETALEIIEMDKAQSAANNECEPAFDSMEMPSVSEVPTVILRIESWNDNGFTAVVEGNVDSETFVIGQTVQVEFSHNACIEVVEDELVTVTRQMPTEEYFPAGTLVQVRFVFFEVDTGIIHAEAISLAPEP